MCGIAGIITVKKNDIRSKVLKMRDFLHHRGPDSQNIHVDIKNNFAFASTRLAILDTNNKSNQPFSSINKNIICYNGEIYNYKEIRKLLIEKNVRLTTNSDTEVLLEGYNLFGTEILQYINGMFSFVIWDNKKDLFFGARDRFGIKPLAYYQNSNKFIFSSEVKAITEAFPEMKKVRYQSLLESSVYGITHQPNSIFQDIKYLEPGCYFEIDSNNNFQIKKYWDIEKKIKKKIHFTDKNEYYETLFAQINKSISKSFVSDVEIGTFLSGGIDSGIITNMACKYVNKKISAFNLSFEQNLKDEFKIEKFKDKDLINFHQNNYNENEIFVNFIDYINALDQPSYDGFNTYLVSKVAKNFTKVCLSGLGADEIFFGYDIINNFLNSRNSSLKNKINFFLYQIKKNTLFETGYFSNISIENFFLNLRKISNFNPKEIFINEINKNINFEDLDKAVLKYDNIDNNFVDRVFLFDIQNYLKNTLLRDSDNMSMCHSLELRPSFLDHELVEFCGRTNDYALSINNQPKFQLKILYEKLFGYLPPKRKIGFNVPIKNLIDNFLKKEILILLKLNDGIYSPKYKNYLMSNITKKNFQTEILNFFILSNWLSKNS
jgi:asparagine synthase (glutamine-hydrolysing)